MTLGLKIFLMETMFLIAKVYNYSGLQTNLRLNK